MLRGILVLAGLSLLTSLNGRAADTVDAPAIKEWPAPWEGTRPRDPSVAPNGKVWFVGQLGNYLAVFDPQTERFERFDLPEGTKPHTVVVAKDGTPWIAGNGNGTILSFDTASGEFTTHTVPQTEGIATRDPHTFAFDGRGGLWFTLQRGNGIGRLDLASGEMRIAPVPTPAALPYGIVSADDGRAWAVLLGTNKLATVDPQSFVVREVELPREKARPRRIGLDSRGRVWYVDFTQGYVGMHDPAGGKIEEWRAPSERSGPYAMAIDDRDIVWFVETFPQPNRMVGFDPSSGRFRYALEVPSGGRVVRHMSFDPKTRTIWFGADTNTLGRLSVPSD